MKDREVEIKKMHGKKIINGKTYEYEYFTLPLNLYIPKSIVERYGTKFKLEIDEKTGVIHIRPKSSP